MTPPKRKAIKDYAKLDAEFKNLLKKTFPDGFNDHLVSFYGTEGQKIRALPFETDETYYLIKVPIASPDDEDDVDDLSEDSDDDEDFDNDMSDDDEDED